VFSVAFSPDNKHVVSGSGDCTIRIWDATTGGPMAGPFDGHTGLVDSVAFLQDGKHVISGSRDCTIRTWDAGTGELVQVVGPFEGASKHAFSTARIAFSPDGKRVVSASRAHTISIWNARTCELIAGPIQGHTSSPISVAFSPDGKFIVSGSGGGTIHIFDARNGDLISGPFRGHTNSVVYSVAFSPNGKFVVSGSGDNAIRIWDAETDRNASDDGTNLVPAATLTPDNQSVVPCLANTTARVWDVEIGQVIAIPFSGHVDAILLCSHDGTLRIMNSNGGPLKSKSGFIERDLVREGWVRCLDLMDSDADDHGLLFWVPQTCEAVCSKETLVVLHKRTTRLDLDRFTHGISWKQCRSAHVSRLDKFINSGNASVTLLLASADSVSISR
jgi:WD40 repeat protein